MTDLSRVHLIGIGGAGMSGVAHILLDRGATVTGSDAKDSRPVRALKAKGAKVALGHDEANLELSGELPTAVVTSFAAIPQDNPELVRAKREGIPLLRRSDLLAELMDGSTQLLLAGTHGKTSTTSMAVVALQAAGEDPSFAIGGQLNRAGTNAHHGHGDVFVAEADESDASLLRYSPDVAVITNIEPDHLDYFGSAESYYQVFDEFADRVTGDGTLVVCLDDEASVRCGVRAAERGVNVLGYGTAEAAARHPEIPAGAVVTEESVEGHVTEIAVELNAAGHEGTVAYHLSVPGRHMVLNSAAALVSCAVAGADPRKLAEGLSGFTGVRRRFELRGEITAGEQKGTRVYDDYAHHPTEVHAVLSAARGKVVILHVHHGRLLGDVVQQGGDLLALGVGQGGAVLGGEHDLAPAAGGFGELLLETVRDLGGGRAGDGDGGGERAAEGNAHGVLGQQVWCVANNDAGAIISKFLYLYASAQERRPESHEALELACSEVGHENSSS